MRLPIVRRLCTGVISAMLTCGMTMTAKADALKRSHQTATVAPPAAK
jgi:hypothetical protein